MAGMPCCSSAASCSGLPRAASSPPWIFGCSVFTRPSIISGEPVTSETSTTSSPSLRSAFAVPPVETSAMPRSLSALAKSTRPALSLTESSARVTFRVSMGLDVGFVGLAGVVGIDQGMGFGFRAAPLDIPQDADLACLAHHAAEHDLRTGLRSARIGEQHALLDSGLLGVGTDAPGLAVAQDQHLSLI